jgi:tRNA 5-methylaminomethyl-2-thiouridine biosynthesis bifunctional protein
MNSSYYLPMAAIEWRDDAPYSPEFGDIYWSKSGGEEEKTHVFLAANELSTRWQSLSDMDQFVIAETGFGFGLNFFLTTNLWRSKPRNGAVLHYVAFEKYLVPMPDIERINIDIDPTLLTEFRRQYPDPIPGPHYLWLAKDICLTLIVGDITETAANLCADIDALFLDGFSPSKNESMWSTRLYKTLTSMMREGATLSTYTVAGHVRRGLIEQGINVSKITGFGSKAQMLKGQVPGVWQPKSVPRNQVTIIGAGLAGLTCQAALTLRDIPVRLMDTKPNRLGAVEQIPQIAISPQLSLAPTPQSRFSLLAFEFIKKNLNYNRCGKLNLLINDVALEKAKKLVNLSNQSLARIVTSSEASQISGLDIKHNALFFPDAGWINPKQTFSHMDGQDCAQNETCLSTIVSRITRQKDDWLLSCEAAPDQAKEDTDSKFQLRAKSVVLATGSMPSDMLQPLNILPVRGQCLVSKPARTSVLKTMLSSEASVFPASNGLQTVASTYRRNSTDMNPSDEDSAWLAKCYESLVPPSPVTLSSVGDVEAVVGIRATTRDRSPVLGQIPDWQQLQAYCDRSSQGRRSKHKITEAYIDYQPNLYAMTGFGSHGLTQSPLCAEILARMINQEPHVKPHYLSPIRFALRDAGIKLPS